MSFEVTVTPTVYNVEVEVNPSVQPFDVVVEVGNVPDLDLTTNGDSGASTFDPLTGELNIPEYTLDGLGGVPESRTITINGTTQDLSADRTFTIPAPDPVTIGSPANGLSVTSGQVLSIGLASGSANGALSSTDWTTFNGKQNALGFTAENVANKAINLTSPDDTKYPTTLAVSTALAGKQDTLTNPITGTGTSGQVAFFNGTTTQTGDNGLFWDNVNKRLGVGTNAPFSGALNVTNSLEIASNLVVGTFASIGQTSTGSYGAVGSNFYLDNLGSLRRYRADFVAALEMVTGGFLFRSGVNGAINSSVSFTNIMRLFNTGNLLIQNGGTFTDAGFRLDVNGTARVQGNTTITGDLTVDTNTLYVDSANNRVGIGSASPSATLDITNLTSVSAGFPFVASFLAPNTPNNSGVLIRIGKNSTLNASFTWDNSVNAFYFQTFSNLYDFEFQGRNNIFNPTTSSIFKSNITISDAKNIVLDTTTGTKIGTSTSQKLSLWNATPNVQPTTAITAGAFVANTSGIANDTATFDGYTMGQVVAALRRIGALA
jgi:hypothetical protein